MSAWKRTFVSAFVAQMLSIIGFSFALPFLPFFIGDLGVIGKAEQAWWAGVVTGATGVTLALFAPLWGILADRYGRKVMVMRSMFGGTMVLLLMSMVRTVGQLVVCRLLQGALTGTISASVALVASVSPPRRSGLTLGMMQAAVFLGVSIGPLIGGIVADHFGYRVAFRFGAGLLFAAGLLIRMGAHEEFTPPEPAVCDARNSYRGIVFNRVFLAAVCVLFSIKFSNTVSNPSFPLIVREILGSAERLNSVTGVLMSVAALTGAASAVLLGHFGDGWGHKRVLLICSAFTAVTAAAHAAAYSLGSLLAVRALFGLSVAGMVPAANAIIHQTTHSGNFGKAYGAAAAFSMTGLALGPLLGGYVASTLGLRAPFILSGAGQVLVIALVAVCIRAGRPPAPPAD